MCHVEYDYQLYIRLVANSFLILPVSQMVDWCSYCVALLDQKWKEIERGIPRRASLRVRIYECICYGWKCKSIMQ